MWWSNKLGLDGVTLADARKMPVAADIGTAVHDMIEAYILGRPATPPVLPESSTVIAEKAFKRFLSWFKKTRMKIVATELWGVDVEYKTGWCLDALAIAEDLDGNLVVDLLDWKTSKGTYPDHAVQVAAYAVFVEKYLAEWFGNPDFKINEVHVLRIDKETGTVSEKSWSRESVEPGWVAFTHARCLHQLKPQLAALCR